jgi:hypothetical protein
MKTDAFDDVRCPFNYKAELKKAREALDAKIGRYASDNRMMSYRQLARKFHISTGALWAIAKGYKHKRKRRPRNKWSSRTISRQCIMKERPCFRRSKLGVAPPPLRSAV